MGVSGPNDDIFFEQGDHCLPTLHSLEHLFGDIRGWVKKKVQPSDFTMQGHEPSDPLTVDICFGITLGISHETNKVSPLISSRFFF